MSCMRAGSREASVSSQKSTSLDAATYASTLTCSLLFQPVEALLVLRQLLLQCRQLLLQCEALRCVQVRRLQLLLDMSNVVLNGLDLLLHLPAGRHLQCDVWQSGG